jgi:hypothetical protein
MKYTLFENNGKQYIMHKGVKIYRTELTPDTFSFNCSLCSHSGPNQYNIIRHINSRHKDFITDNAVKDKEMEGGKLTEEEKDARKYQEEKRKREKEFAKEEAQRKRKEKLEAEKEANRQRAIEFEKAREARVAKIEKRKALKADVEQGLQYMINARKAQDEASKEMKNKIQEDVTQRDLVDVLRMDTLEAPEPSPESEIMKNNTLLPEEETDKYSMEFEEPEPTKENITIEPEIVEDSTLPAEEENLPDPVFQKADMENILANMEEIKDINCKKDLDKMEKSYYDHIKKVEKRFKNKIDKANKEKKGNDCKKELEKIKKEFKTTIKDTIEGIKSGMMKVNDDDMTDLIENANKFADSMIDFAKRSENEKLRNKMTGRKGGTRKKRVREMSDTEKHNLLVHAGMRKGPEKKVNKTANNKHKRKTKVNKKTRHNKQKTPMVTIDPAKLKGRSNKSRLRIRMKEINKAKK